MSTRDWYTHGIKCGHCKNYHTSVDQVRFCSLGLAAYSLPTQQAQSQHVPAPPPIGRYSRPTAPTVPPAAPVVAQSPQQERQWFDELQVPPGRYAVENKQGELKFYVIRENTEPRWKNRRKVFVQASDDLHLIRDRTTKHSILKAILDSGLEIATLRYGLELGVCGVCGRTLTDEDSRAMGIGPVCREKVGWL